MQPNIRIQDYDYNLPEDRIAKYPLDQRDSSKLLLYNIGVDNDGNTLPEISHSVFSDIVRYIPSGSFMVFNNTKVVPARLLFKRDTGAVIEVFCLEPVSPADYQINFSTTEKCRWKAIIGNLKRWKNDTLHLYTSSDSIDNATEDENPSRAGMELLRKIDLKADLISRDGNTAVVEFSWNGDNVTFSSVLDLCGRIPIPPYLNRGTKSIDYERYQTVYARLKGSVAAPTAGLHFTDRVIDALKHNGVTVAELCLHVGAGTFLPVKSEYISGHTMHTEPFSVSLEFLEKLLEAIDSGRRIVSVGTTSTRCLESLYFLGVHCIEKGGPSPVEQWEPYRDEGYSTTPSESVSAIISYMKANCLSTLVSRTGIIIVPGYEYRIIEYLVTNFHQPQSTLLLLVSAFATEQGMRDIYRYALDNSFRFLSYGDSSLLRKK